VAARLAGDTVATSLAFDPGGACGVDYASLLSMPVGRPRLDDLLGGIDYWSAHDYPARGGD